MPHIVPYAKYEIKLLEYNALAINLVALYIDGKEAAENYPVPNVMHEYFYKAEDGTPFAAE